ncbi:MAG: lipopolysaccharide biosynthesis protein [Pirellulales bacterium]|nr:lipopolysaccharide biosynthesis protein [Pirellulales bacterium]
MATELAPSPSVAARADAPPLSSASVAVAPRPVTGWRRLVRDSVVASGATIVCQGLGVVTALVLRMLLDPAQMGVWQGLKLFLSYANYANLGISKGATRELSIALGRGDAQAAERGLSIAFTFNTMASVLYALLLVAAACVVAGHPLDVGSNVWSLGLMAVAALAIGQRHVTFLVTILRARQAFSATAALSLLEAVLTLAACALFVHWWGLPGMYAGTLVVLAASAGFLHAVEPARLRWIWDAAESKRLVAIGAPILMFGVLGTLFRSLDRLMILAYLPDREYQLGCYSVALLVTGQLYGLANMLSIVMAPRYGELFGRTSSPRDVARLAARASEPLAALTALLGGLAIVAGAPLLSSMLPDYRSGLMPLVWLVPGTAISVLALPASQCLIAVDRQRRALWPLILALLATAFGNHVALRAGYGLTGVAVATSAGFVLHFLLTAFVALWEDLSSRERQRFLLGVSLTLAPTLGLAMTCELFDRSAVPNLLHAALKSVAVIAIWATTTWIGWHAGGWRTLARGAA